MKLSLLASVALLATAMSPALNVAAYIMPGSSEWDALEVDDGPFDDLMDSLSSPTVLQRTHSNNQPNQQHESAAQLWQQQCTAPFEREGFPSLEESFYGISNGSNYELFDQPSGLCSDHLSCAYVGCYWPFEDDDNNTTVTLEEPLLAADDLPEDDLLNLPAYVLHPKSVGDIVAVVSFCNQHDIAISVKVSGHSYIGGSTSKGSILIHMRNFPKYAIDHWEDAFIDCQTLTQQQDEAEAVSRTSAVTGVTDHVCRLATARGVPAALRVGGGEVWDEVYRAVHAHNSNAAAQNSTTDLQQYHIVGAAAGTVSAAGGWLSGGGLSGTAGMRLFGFGVDQILQLEMVLANGWHVRFGPSEWEQQEDEQSAIPKTTAVQGECNMGSTSTDESLWDWQPCPTTESDSDNNIDFADLWYAVRGGAAGYGVVTAAVYQLPEKPGKLHVLWNNGIPQEIRSSLSEQAIKAVTELWMNFLIDFFFDPTSLNITNEQSNNCGAPATAISMDPFVPGSIYCHNNAGPVMINAWTDTLQQANSTLQELGIDGTIVPVLDAVFSIIAEVEDIVENSYFWPALRPDLNAGVPPGRLFDFPKPGVVPTYYDNYWTAILPKSWLLDKERSIPFLYDYATRDPIFAKMFYVLGGRTALDHDHHNAISSSQRDASFVISTLGSLEFTERLLQEIYGEVEGTTVDFPAGAEYNHVGPNEFGPLKEDWTKACPMSLSRQEKAEQCISLQESIWGTTNLAKLTAIKNSVDPNNRFNCFGCVGYVDIHASSSMETAEEEPQTELTADEAIDEDSDASTTKEGPQQLASAGVLSANSASLLMGCLMLFSPALGLWFP